MSTTIPSQVEQPAEYSAATPAGDRSRRHPEMEKYTEIKPGWGGGYAVRLVVEQQSFTINYEAEDMAKAEWMRDMLCIALAKIAAAGPQT